MQSEQHWRRQRRIDSSMRNSKFVSVQWDSGRLDPLVYVGGGAGAGLFFLAADPAQSELRVRLQRRHVFFQRVRTPTHSFHQAPETARSTLRQAPPLGRRPPHNRVNAHTKPYELTNSRTQLRRYRNTIVDGLPQLTVSFGIAACLQVRMHVRTHAHTHIHKARARFRPHTYGTE